MIDADKSWQVFTMLEAFADGMGAWDFVGVLGKPFMQLPDWLVTDLMTWKYIVGIVKGIHDKEDKQEE